jgi:hypothetical protein
MISAKAVNRVSRTALALPLVLLAITACDRTGQSGASVDATGPLADAKLEEIVRRSTQYVAMFNVNNKFALDVSSPMNTGGYNRVFASTELADHRLESIARPNNDTLFAAAMIDVTEEPMVLRIPAFDSTYVSLMVTGYDHYVNIPMSTRLGDFEEPETMLFYSARTPGYDGAPGAGIDRIFEVTGDFVSAVFRVMPHAAEPERRDRNIAAMRAIELIPLSEFLGDAEDEVDFVPWGSPPGIAGSLTLKEDLARFPAFGSDFEIFEDRLLEAMQFIFNHTTFDPDDEMDAALLELYEPLGVAPGRVYDPNAVAVLDGAAVRSVAERVAAEALATMHDREFVEANISGLFQPKGEIGLELQVIQSVVGPIGQPASEAVYPPIATADGKPMNAMFDYEIVMTAEELPPVNAFWSATLYDNDRGFFVPNDRFKYSVGENAGYKLDKDGGIRIVIAAEQPEGVPEENWLPINRGDYGSDVIMRLYSPDLERFANWTPPKAERIR